ncbi:phage tail tape measure protein [Desulfovibrio sp.]|uniref:phage tail tape measure protein n=1 Tax=Desulfovibrio sp. TaxID=885 RepID=UPI003D0D9FE7
MKTSLIIDLAGNLQSRARQYSQALTGMARQASGAFSSLRSAAATAGRGLDQLAGRYTAGIAGLGLAYKATRAVMDSAQLDKFLARVAITGEASAQQASSLRTELYEMSRQTGRPMQDLLEGFYGLIQAGQSWSEALGTIRAINPAMAVTGASADTLASSMTVAAQAFKFDLADVKVATLVLDQMTKAGYAGNAELEDLSSIFARVGNNAKTAGLSFSQTLAFIERLSLVEKNPERLATLADSTLRLFTNNSYMKEAAKATGVKFYDAKGQKREAFDVLKDIRNAYRKFSTDAQRDKAFATAFGKTDLDTQRGLRIFFDGNTIEEAESMATDIKDASGTIAKDLPNAIKNSVDQVGRLKEKLGEAADSFAQPINAAITDGINKLLADDKISGKEMLVGAGAAGLAGFGALKLVAKGLQSAGGRFAGGMAQRMAQGAGGLAGLKLPLPVYVVNKQMSLTHDAMLGKDAGLVVPDGGAGKGSKGAKGTSAPLPGGRRARLARGLGRAGGMAMAVNTAIDGYQIVTDDQATIGDKAGAVVDVAGQAAGGWAGAALGAKVGATIGTAIAPGLGTAIGGALGGVVGGIAGSNLAQGLIDAVGSWFGGDTPKQLDPTVFNEAAQTMQAAAQLMAKGVAVDVNVQGNAQATLSRGTATIYSGSSYANAIADATAGY